MHFNLFDLLRIRLDQHLKFFDTLERIRWQFAVTFGAGAAAALFFAMDIKTTSQGRAIALLLVFGFSLAGLVAQIRIFALAEVLWRRMLVLQAREFEEVRAALGDAEAADLRAALSFPRLGVRGSGTLRLLTAGMASCFLFSLSIGVGTTLALDGSLRSSLFSRVSGVLIAGLLIVTSLVGSERYARALETTKE
jgi:hypothetical protein